MGHTGAAMAECHCAVLFWAPVVHFRLYVGNIVILSVASRRRHCCCVSCCYSGNAAVAVPFAPAARMLRTITNTTKQMHTYEFVCVSVQSNATSTFLLSRGNAVGPPDSIGRRHALGIRSSTLIHTHTHWQADRQSVLQLFVS